MLAYVNQLEVERIAMRRLELFHRFPDVSYPSPDGRHSRDAGVHHLW